MNSLPKKLRKMMIFLVLLLFCNGLSGQKLVCPPGGVFCITDVLYQTCQTISGVCVMTSSLTTCSDGSVCNSNSTVELPCVPITTTLTTSTPSTTRRTTPSTTSRTTPSTTSRTTPSTTSRTTPSTTSRTTTSSTRRTTPSTTSRTTPSTTSRTTTSTTRRTTPSTTSRTTPSTTSRTTPSTTSRTTTSTTRRTTPSTTRRTTPSTTSTTTTTTLAPVTPPVCTQEAVFPGPQCNTYYRCVLVMWWYETVLENCPANQAFNAKTGQCEGSTTCGTSTTTSTTSRTTPSTTSRTTTTTRRTTPSTTRSTTTSTTSTTTTTLAPVTPPVCTQEAVYPGPQCNTYYRCVLVMWWYETVVENCPANQAFNAKTGQCEGSTTCATT